MRDNPAREALTRGINRAPSPDALTAREYLTFILRALNPGQHVTLGRVRVERNYHAPSAFIVTDEAGRVTGHCAIGDALTLIEAGHNRTRTP